MRTLLSILFLSPYIIASQAQAISITPEALPGAISTCSNCVVLPNSSADLGYMSVFTLARLDNTGGATLSNLVRYTLTQDSALNSVNYYDPVTTHENYSGYIWLEAPQNIYSNTALFNVYTDQITPSPEPYQIDQNNTWTFEMNLQSAIAGTGSAYFSGQTDYIVSGDMQIIDGMLLCIECGTNVTLNLIGLGYTQAGASFINPNDGRALLLGYDDFWDLRSTTRDFYVQAIPVPAAIWLFTSGVLALFGFINRRR